MCKWCLHNFWDDCEGNCYTVAEVVVNELILLDGPHVGTEVADDEAPSEAAS